MENAVLRIILINLQFLLLASRVIITNPPQNVTVCINNVAEISCGFTGADPNLVRPDWIIIMRNEDGSIVSNETVFGAVILSNLEDNLEWVPDLDSGTNNASNSKLSFGPVDKTDNQSSFQCYFVSSKNQILAISNIGIITVVGLPSVDITMDEVCVTSVTISLTIRSHSACGAFSNLVNLVSSNGTILSVSSNDSTYTFDRLTANTSYTVIVTVINGSNPSDSQTFNEFINTHSLSAPNPISNYTINISSTNNDTVRITWKKPTADACMMSEIEYFDVNISCNNSKSLNITTNKTVITFSSSDLLNNESNIACVITIVVYNNEGMSSEPSSKQFAIPDDSNNNNRNNDDDGNSGSGNNGPDSSSDDNNAVTISVAVVVPFFGFIIVIIILSSICYCYNSNSYCKNDKKVSVVGIVAAKNSYNHTTSSDVEAYAISGSGILSTGVSTSTSGPNSMMTMLQVTTQSSTIKVHEPSHHTGNESFHDESAPALPPKLVYAELQQLDKVPKSMNTDKYVPYTETIKTE